MNRRAHAPEQEHADGRRRDLLGDQAGVVFTEYTIVLAFAGLLVAIALAALGPKLVNSYSSRRDLLYDSQRP